jgi:hypothetical protein
MKMYFSGSFREVIARYMIERDASRLFTFAYPKEAFMYLNIATDMGKRCDILIDSGAFTAWNKGTPVELDTLLNYHQRILDLYGDAHDFQFIALDVIPGERGRMATPTEIEDGMKESFDNFLRMAEHHGGAEYVLPVYHSGEPAHFRDAFLQHTNHICLSMNQNLSERERVAWAMEAQVEGALLHGLAATGTRIMEYVDWYSVDSAGWLMTAAMGSVLWSNGRRFFPLAVSEDSPQRKEPNKHIANRDDAEFVKDTIADKGYDWNVLATDYLERCRWNIDAWLAYQPRKNVKRTEGLFEL